MIPPPAAGDCELVRDAFLGQPANALSSLAYVVVAAMLWRSRPVLAFATAAVGAGSFLFHGPMPDVAKLVHDGSLLVLAVVLAGEAVVRRPPHSALVLPAALLAVAVVVFLLSRTDRPLCYPEFLVQGHALWHCLTATTLWLWGRASPPTRLTSEA